MKTSEAKKFYGTSVRLAEALQITEGAIPQWGEYPPESRQLQLERITLGALKAEPGCLDRVLGFKEQTLKEAARGTAT